MAGAAAVAKPATPGAAAMLTARRANTAKVGTPGAPADPFAPMSDAQIQAEIAKYTGRLPAGMTGTQIQSTAQGELDPIIAAVTKDIQGQASTAGSQITSNAAQLAKELGAIDYTAPYAGAESDQAAVDAALQQSLNGGGSQLASELRSKLGMIGDPSVAAAADAAGARGSALGTAQLDRGSASMSDLIAQAAAAGLYGKQQPTIARESGLQDVAGVNAKATQSIADETAKLEESLPSIVNALRTDSRTADTNRASLAAHLYETLTGQNISRAVADAGIGKADNTLALDYSKLGAQTAPKPSASLSRAYGYPVDQYGNRIGKGTLPGYTTNAKGDVVKAPKPAAAAKPLTAGELRTVAGTANQIVSTAYLGGAKTGVTFKSGPNKGQPLPQLTYQQTIDELRNEGLLADPRSAKVALGALNRTFGEGERGRPVSAAGKAAFKAAKADIPGSPLDALLQGGK